jgi:copper(I)-binding protein
VRNLALLVALVATPAFAQVEVVDAWTRATPPGAKVAGGYLTIRNKSSTADRLVAVSSPAAARVETHLTVVEGGVAKMRETKGFEIAPGARLELKPGGAHLMFVDIKRPFKEGETIAATLGFERAGEVKVEFRVARLGAASRHGH